VLHEVLQSISSTDLTDAYISKMYRIKEQTMIFGDNELLYLTREQKNFHAANGIESYRNLT